MSTQRDAPPMLPAGVVLRHAHGPQELAACFPVISALRKKLRSAEEWVEAASELAIDGYRVLAAWDGSRALAMAGYRVTENLIHGHFLYVDDLAVLEGQRRRGLGGALLAELSTIGIDEFCNRLVLDTAATNEGARRFYAQSGLCEQVVGFIKPLGKQP